MQILSSDELSFDYTSESELEDLETGQRRLVDPAAIRAHYHEALDAFPDALPHRGGRSGHRLRALLHEHASAAGAARPVAAARTMSTLPDDLAELRGRGPACCCSALPVLAHLLSRAPADVKQFPTLRFIEASRLPATASHACSRRSPAAGAPRGTGGGRRGSRATADAHLGA